MRRVWRLGQTQPVKVLYAVYQGTLESAALTLMGEKMKAALLLYGDSASSAIVEEGEDTGQFMTELAKRVLGGEMDEGGMTGLLQESQPDLGAWAASAAEDVPVSDIDPQDVVVSEEEEPEVVVKTAVEEVVRPRISWLEFIANAKGGTAQRNKLRRSKEKPKGESQLQLWELQPSLFERVGGG